MAGDWIPAFDGLSQKREVLEIARRISRTPHEVVGLLIDLWQWAQRETEEPFIPALTIDDCAAALRLKRSFLDAVVSVGWLREENGGLRLPNSEEWISRGAKARLLKTRRQKKWRGDDSVDVSEARARLQERLPQNRTEQNSKETSKDVSITPHSPQGLSLPEVLNTPEFLAAFDGWVAMKIEKKYKPTARGLQQSLNDLGEWAEQAGIGLAITACKKALAGEWKGVFDPRESRNGGYSKPKSRDNSGSANAGGERAAGW